MKKSILILVSLCHFIYGGEKYIVAIDPGHTIKRFGAVGVSGTTEYSYNIKIAKILNTLTNSQKSNISSFIINPTGRAISLSSRSKIALDNNATLLISLHHDSAQLKRLRKVKINGRIRYSTDKLSGYSIFVSKKNQEYERSLNLARHIGTKLIENNFIFSLHHAEKIKGENRVLVDKKNGIYLFDNLVVLKKSKMPAVLIECGIIVNPKEEQKIKATNYHQQLSLSILAGIKSFLLNNGSVLK